jgi:hypothetical protein
MSERDRPFIPTPTVDIAALHRRNALAATVRLAPIGPRGWAPRPSAPAATGIAPAASNAKDVGDCRFHRPVDEVLKRVQVSLRGRI